MRARISDLYCGDDPERGPPFSEYRSLLKLSDKSPIRMLPTDDAGEEVAHGVTPLAEMQLHAKPPSTKQAGRPSPMYQPVTKAAFKKISTQAETELAKLALRLDEALHERFSYVDEVVAVALVYPRRYERACPRKL